MEREKEIKKSTGRKLIKIRAPKRLWNDYPEFESYIQSNQKHDISKLDEEVPEKSKFCELNGSNRCRFRMKKPIFQRCHIAWVEPSIFIGPAMMAKLEMANCQILHRLTYHVLIQDKMDSVEHIRKYLWSHYIG